MKKKRKKCIVSILILLLTLVLLIPIYMILTRQYDYLQQKTHLRKLSEIHDIPHNLPDRQFPDSMPINRIRVLATHNSYRKSSDPIRLFFISLEDAEEVPALKYTNKSLYKQLDLNVRSFEFDLRVFGNRFTNNHVPLVDDRSVAPDFGRALEEIKIWSERNQDHVPIIILVELKEDWMILAPWLDGWTDEALVRLDAQFQKIFKDRIIRPKDVQGNSKSLRDAVVNGGWPSLAESRGKIMLVLMMDDSNRDLYSNKYRYNPKRCSFIMPEPHSKEAAFLIQNEPDLNRIKNFVRQGFIVRTRADADLKKDFSRKRLALESEAQIVTTDFIQGYKTVSSDYSLSWKEISQELD